MVKTTKEFLKKLIEVCENIPMFVYKKVKDEKNGVNLYSFHYTFKNMEDLRSNPLNREMRGLVVVDYEGYIDIYPSVPSFDTFNTYEGTLLEDLKEKRIVYLQEKSDGSLIIPFKINNEIKFKTGRSFDNNVLDTMYKEVSNIEDIKLFIEEMYNEGYYPLFEYVSPNNEILVKYDKPELRLIMVREIKNITDNMIINNIDFHNNNEIMDLVNKYNISVTERYTKFDNKTFEDLYKDVTTNTSSRLYKLYNSNNFEGFVIMFEDGTLIKFKTQWFLENHHKFDLKNKLMKDYDKRKETFLYLILNEKLDELPSDILDEYKDEINTINKMVEEDIKMIKNNILLFKNKLKNGYTMSDISKDILSNEYSKIIFRLIRIDNIEDEIIYQEVKRELMRKIPKSIIKMFK